jgi:hypothetical protein
MKIIIEGGNDLLLHLMMIIFRINEGKIKKFNSLLGRLARQGTNINGHPQIETRLRFFLESIYSFRRRVWFYIGKEQPIRI